MLLRFIIPTLKFHQKFARVHPTRPPVSLEVFRCVAHPVLKLCPEVMLEPVQKNEQTVVS